MPEGGGGGAHALLTKCVPCMEILISRTLVETIVCSIRLSLRNESGRPTRYPPPQNEFWDSPPSPGHALGMLSIPGGGAERDLKIWETRLVSG